MSPLDEAWNLYQLERYAEAEKILTHWLTHIPVDARARAMLGLICCKQGRSKEARQNIRRAVDIDPASDFVYIAQAWIECWCQDFYAAQEALSNAYRFNPDHPEYPQLLEHLRKIPAVTHEIDKRTRTQIPVELICIILASALPAYLVLTGQLHSSWNIWFIFLVGACLFGGVLRYFFPAPPRDL